MEDLNPTSESDSTAGTSGSVDTTVADSPETSGSPSTGAPSDETTTTSSDLPVAPEFTLELGTGGEYRLSDSENPVYLVFWAEW